MPRRRVTSWVAVAGAVLALAVPATAAARVHSSKLFGLVSATYYEDPPSASEFSTMHAAGVRIFRTQLYWRGIEPSKGTFDWSDADAVVGAAASQGVRILPYLAGSPQWVTGCSGMSVVCDATPPRSRSELKAWKKFVSQAVARYGPGGTYWTNPSLYQLQFPGHSAMPIKDWQIWNEPNLKRFFRPRPSARAYAKLLKVAAKAIRSKAPKADIVSAGIAPGLKGSKTAILMPKYLKSLYKVRGAKRSFDAVAIHPYAPKLSQLAANVGAVRRIMNHAGDRRAPIWLTEVGWGSGPANAGDPHSVGLNGQARLIGKSFPLFVHKARRWHLAKVFFFSWTDTPGGTGGAWYLNAGLLYADLSPKPSWGVFQTKMHQFR
ncbi:MAG TPA: glycosyl hydrolase [Solirubrobacterales bacterium]|nr:glycosyl hydrolase [Solirubrobacterales bacterium]